MTPYNPPTRNATACTPMILTDWSIRLQRPARRRNSRRPRSTGTLLALVIAGAAIAHAGQLLLLRRS